MTPIPVPDGAVPARQFRAGTPTRCAIPPEFHSPRSRLLQRVPSAASTVVASTSPAHP